MAETQVEVRVARARTGSATVDTGLPVLDHLIREFAVAARLRIVLEVAPGTADEEAARAGRALGHALAAPLVEPGSAGRGWSIVPAAEALAAAALEVSAEPLLVANVDFREEGVAGVATDVASRFLEELTHAGGLNLHVRLLEGRDPQHVLAAIFKAVGAAVGDAVRSPIHSEEEEP